MSRLGRSISAVLAHMDLSLYEGPTHIDVPIEPEKFYQDFGFLKHPRTRKPVKCLTPYQIAIWKTLLTHKKVLCIKSNKVGLTTSCLLTDLHLALLPSSHPLSCRGYDQLVIGQSIPHAREHLYTLRKLILNSPKYHDCLISKPTELVLRDEVTKVTVLFIKNPDNPYLPSRIIGLGASNDGSILSWKNIKGIHISDLAATQGDYAGALNAAMTRLANTSGSIMIESIPDFVGSPLHQLFENPGDFKTFRVTANEALASSLITQEHLASEMERLGLLFQKYYSAEFLAPSNQWYKEEWIHEESYMVE